MPNTHPHQRGSDQIFENITIGRVIKSIILIGSGIAGLAAILGAITFFLVTKPDLNKVAGKADSIAQVTDSRLSRIEHRQDQAEAIHQLLVPMATLECIRLQREKSITLAVIARLPCDSLTR